MALNATTLRDAIITALDAEGVYPNTDAKDESEVLVGIIATAIVDHITANAEVTGVANTEGIRTEQGDAVAEDASITGDIS